MPGRRKVGARREPLFDAIPLPGFDIRLKPHDRPAGPAGDHDRPRKRPATGERSRSEGGRPRPQHQPGGPSTPQRRRPRRRRRSRLARGAYWSAVAGLWAVIAVICLVVWVGIRLPAIHSLEIPRRPPTISIVGLGGAALATRGDMGGVAVPLGELPTFVPKAFIAIEDRRFYSHYGVDPWGIARAALANILRFGVAQGGSTITQQLAKNLFLTQERTVHRKLQELALALWLEHTYSKDQILELYLNRVYFGSGAWGVEAAAQRYFQKSARQLSLAEAAVLAGIVKAPSRLAPSRNPDSAERRAQIVLAAMAEERFISENTAQAALANPAQAVKSAAAASVNYVADWVMDMLADVVGRIEQDVVVETSIDPGLQAAAEKALTEELAQNGEKFGVGQGAMVVMTPDGIVRALIGGRNYTESQFNRAVAARRQPGSAFKPFVYLTALERGLSPDTIREDKPIAIKGWKPENYTREYFGPVTLTQALSRSLNTVSVRLTLEFGPVAVARTAYRLGISSKLEANPSLALGTSEVSLIELVSAYAPFANGGFAVTPQVVERVRTADGKTIYTRDKQGLGRIIEARYVGMMNTMMQETLYTGTARRAELPGRPAAGKTGTSQDFRDAWFVGYTGNLVAGVWLGNDDSSPTKKATGGGMPADIWSRFMKAAHKGVAVAALPGAGSRIAAAVPTFRNHGSVPDVGAATEPDARDGRTQPPAGRGGLDGWLFDRLFGRR